MKYYILLLILVFTTVFAQAQADSTTVWITTDSGTIYKLNVNNCSSELYCHTNRPFYDIALTPDGNLWGNTSDSLYQIYANGYTRPVGKIPFSPGLGGLNDSTLLVVSMQNLISVKTTDASASQVGNIGYNTDGDLAWLGKDLYMFAGGHFVKITLNDTYSAVTNVDAVLPDSTFYTPGLTTAYLNNFGYSLISFPGNVEFYRIDTADGNYHEICSNPQATALGAASMIFPPDPITMAIQNAIKNSIQFNVFPNPTSDEIFLGLKGFNGKISDTEIRLYDITGKLLVTLSLKTLTERITLKSYSPGLYILELRYQNKSIQRQKILRI
ncbi:T9SS type A sorting domain-containing protein [Pedobacter sp. B4-66]|uniref:T9SS type A sorting domain-containing protein n=1 Tax=Pedobacter sp. B4-66 TaxID=2817280 RepID=UPI001BDB54A8|nr:T9SS type A sorting domain-containing protein [Pedobacter sp. B4-66]